MKNYPHLQFISANQIDITSLPKMLQKRLAGFDELTEDLKHAMGQDHDQLEERLEVLSLELEEDLQEIYEDELENNEPVEDEPTQEKKKQAENHTDNNTESKPNIESKKLQGDEAILEQLYSSGRVRDLGRSTLKQLGLKSDLRTWEIRIGNYTLKRTGIFSYKYNLLKTRSKTPEKS